MADAAPPPRGNRLLGRLSERQLALLEPVALPRALTLDAPGEAIGHAVLPNSGLASVMACDGRGRRVEVGLLGRDGMSGLALAMGSDRSPHRAVVRVTGAGRRAEAGALREALAADPGLRAPLLRHAQARPVQAAPAALAHARHGIAERLARWLLMGDDRVGTGPCRSPTRSRRHPGRAPRRRHRGRARARGAGARSAPPAAASACSTARAWPRPPAAATARPRPSRPA